MKKPGCVSPVIHNKIQPLSGQGSDSCRDPESRNFEGFWMPVFTGVTTRVAQTFPANFRAQDAAIHLCLNRRCPADQISSSCREIRTYPTNIPWIWGKNL
jgi:hypothetical protein